MGLMLYEIQTALLLTKPDEGEIDLGMPALPVPGSHPLAGEAIPYGNPQPTRTIGVMRRKSTTRSAPVTAVCDVVDRVMRH